MRKIYPAVVLAAAMLMLAACASQPKVPFDRSPATQVTTIGIVTPSFPSESSVVLASTVGQSFGLIGALVDAGMKANRDLQFNALLTAHRFSAEQSFMTKLREDLAANGYAVVEVPATREKRDFMSQYPTIAEPVDAYLDLVATGHGYVAAGIGSTTPYRPIFAIKARLVSARDKSILMQDFIVYNPINAPDAITTIAPDPAYQFEDFDALMGKPAPAVEGLQVAAAESAGAVGKLLK